MFYWLRIGCSCAVLLLLGTAQTAWAEETSAAEQSSARGLAALTRAAKRNSPGLRAAQHKIAAARARLGEAWVSPFFQFKATTSFGLAPEARGTPVVSPDDDFPIENRWLPVFRAEVEGVVPLWTFGKLSSARDAAQAGVRGAELERKRTQAHLVFDVRRAYYSVQLALDVLQMISEGRSKLETAVRKLRERIESEDPDVNPNDQYRLSSVLAEVEAREAEASGLATSATAALSMLTGIRRVQVPECPLEPLAFTPKPLGFYQRTAQSKRPESGMLRAAAAASEADLSAKQAGYFPDLGLALHASTTHAPGVTDQRNPFADDPANYRSLGAGLVARWSLDVWGNAYRSRRARYRLLETREELQQAVEGIALEVATAHSALMDAARRVQAWEQGRRDTRRWFVATAQADRVGVADIEELVDAVQAYFKARYAHLQGIHDYNVGVARLERAVGVELLPAAEWDRACRMSQ